MKEIKVTSDEALKEIEPECSTEDAIGRNPTWCAEGCYVWFEFLDIEELKVNEYVLSMKQFAAPIVLHDNWNFCFLLIYLLSITT